MPEKVNEIKTCPLTRVPCDESGCAWWDADNVKEQRCSVRRIADFIGYIADINWRDVASSARSE